MYERCHRDGSGDGTDDGFADRSLWLGLTFGGADRLTGDLAPGCSAALSAVLEALGSGQGRRTSGPRCSAGMMRWRRLAGG